MADEDGDLDLAQLLCARLCHDLAGPLGGAAAGAELLADEDEDNEAAQLLAGSVAAATRRLAFYRAAFGHGQPPQIGAQLQDLVAGLIAATAIPGAAVTLDWQVPARLEPAAARCLLNLALLGREALPKGGTLTLGAAGDSVMAEARGPGARLAEAAAVTAATAADLTPRGAQAYYTARLARTAGGLLTVQTISDGLCLKIAGLSRE